ncbi:HEPN domain-containing protein [Pedobacter frigoris]|uniref:HEPN domain-containing protein n=1 Tax=Pedobacter frigoris TaxID=2571272 RepID=UPI00292D0625|nr:HEPN domain-containing protein [Pedobacter frigoris]
MANPNNLLTSNMLNQHDFINRITQLMPVERIYISHHYNAQESQVKELTIVLPRVSKIHTAEAKLLIGMIMADYHEYSFTVFTVQEIKRALHYGSMVFYTICKEENLLYQSEGIVELLSADMTAKAVLKKAKRNFEKEWKKITGFGEGFQFYFDQAKYDLAAFMLHQVVELSYRTVELLVIGRDKAIHSIRHHQSLMKGYLRELGAVFNEEDEAEMALLTLLDGAYRSVRYEVDYEISQEQLQRLSAKADLVKSLVLRMYEQMVSDFKEEKPLDLIIARICDLVPVVQIYKLARYAKADVRLGMFSSAEKEPVEVHYYLLVICDAPCTSEVLNVQGIIKGVTLLMHSVKDVQDALRDNQLFFHELLRKGELIYGAESVGFAIPELDDKQVLLHKTQLWYNRYNRAVALVEAAADVTEEENGIVMASMLSQAMVQICLVYIEVSISYRPNQLNLKHLFALCRMIDPLIDEVFPTSREEDRKLFEVLLDADRNLRYRVHACVDTTDQCMLLRRCNDWLERVKVLRD